MLKAQLQYYCSDSDLRYLPLRRLRGLRVATAAKLTRKQREVAVTLAVSIQLEEVVKECSLRCKPKMRNHMTEATASIPLNLKKQQCVRSQGFVYDCIKLVWDNLCDYLPHRSS